MIVLYVPNLILAWEIESFWVFPFMHNMGKDKEEKEIGRTLKLFRKTKQGDFKI